MYDYRILDLSLHSWARATERIRRRNVYLSSKILTNLICAGLQITLIMSVKEKFMKQI